ncbi:translation initiation factor IF-3 [Candidatus Xenohaliotis californiensis]
MGIQASEVKLIDDDGNMLGIMSKENALKIAEEKGLDLVLISNAENTPVCKTIDYGKHKYNMQKKSQKTKKKQKNIELKELKIRPSIQQHDYQVKINKAKKFLTSGNKVKFIMRLRGRELMFKQHGHDLFVKINEDLLELGKISQQHSQKDLENGYLFCIYTPNTTK